MTPTPPSKIDVGKSETVVSPSNRKRRHKRRRRGSVTQSPKAVTTPNGAPVARQTGPTAVAQASNQSVAVTNHTSTKSNGASKNDSSSSTSTRPHAGRDDTTVDDKRVHNGVDDGTGLDAASTNKRQSSISSPSPSAKRAKTSPAVLEKPERKTSASSACSSSSSSSSTAAQRRASLLETSPPPPLPTSSDLLIGAGIFDITGPAAEVGMFGYAKVGQLTSGIHMRLRARAFAFHHEPTRAACVYVVCDLGMISEWVTQTVLSRLSVHPAIPTGTYTRENVMISATHTHCAPGGISHYVIYSMHPPLRGADRQNFECVVHGIVEAIVRAHRNLQPGVIRTATGECLNASVNRSKEAYEANPKEERAQFKHDTDKEMTLWRLDGVNGFPIGMINWFAVHPTSMGNWYTLITGDNKGYAAHMFEQEQGANHLLDRPRSFVAAFAQSNEGDVSPNICGPRHNETQHKDFERMLIVAKAQLKTARSLYLKALYSSPIMGPIKVAHHYVDYGSIQLKPRWHHHKDCPPSTSSGCIGVSMISGTTFDGRGVPGVPEGVTWGMYPKVTAVPGLQDSQKEKPVFFPTARYGLSPTTLPLQLFLIGEALALAAIPFEATTMAGRRLRSALQSSFIEHGSIDIQTPVISGLSNAYCGYLTTREEYAVQRYEGASTHFGPNQLCATMQQFEQLIEDMFRPKHGKKVKTTGALQPKIGGVGVLDYNVPVVHDGLLPGAQYGSIISDVLSEYCPGSTVTVTFHAAHPKNNLRTQGTFLEVHRWLEDDSRRDGGVWVMHADDGDTNTFFHWRRNGTFASVVTIEWWIPAKTPPGKYRIKVNGDYKRFFTGEIASYTGLSSEFEVKFPVSDDDDASVVLHQDERQLEDLDADKGDQSDADEED
ncbi:hypothetical protein PINS_up008095 [Pythium insidiosum]|nr:hypothetical protein PINS_up008095 [Pythium insidiosum]